MSIRGKQLPQVNRPFMSFARRPAVRVAALLWIWLTVMFAPMGATLHAMSHLPSSVAARTGAPERDDGRHGAVAHCHVCDEWQFLDHVLPSAEFADATSAPADSPGPLPLGMRLAVETPWILARAPPRQEARSSVRIALRAWAAGPLSPSRQLLATDD